MSRYIVIAALIGASIGFIVQLFSPNFLLFEALFNKSLRQATGIPSSPQYISGSILSVGSLTPLILGLIGALTGLVLYKLKNSK